METTSVRLRGWRSIPFALLGGAAAAAAILAATFAPGFGGGRAANADVNPIGCLTALGSSAASIEIQSAPPNVQDGDTLQYLVGARLPAPISGVACTVFDVDVFIRVPGSALYDSVPVCRISELVSGEHEFCPGTVPYTVESADSTGGLLVADVRTIGNKHDRAAECIEEEPRDPNAVNQLPICFDAEATSLIAMPTPTPTATATATATSTPTRTSTPVTPSSTPQRTRTPERENPTRTNTPAPTRTSAVLPATPRPTQTAIGVTALPSTGGQPGGGADVLPYVIAGIAAAAALSAGAGLEAYRRRAR